MPGYQAFSFIRRVSAATANILFCCLTENVGVILLFSFLEIFVLSTFCAVYYRNTFIILRSSFFDFLLSEKFKQNVNLVNRLSNSICTWSCCTHQRRPHHVRTFVTIQIGAKNEVLDPVYPLPCLPLWSKSLSYRKLPITPPSKTRPSPKLDRVPAE